MAGGQAWREVAPDVAQAAPLLNQIGDPIGQVTADGAYDGAPTYQTIAQHDDGIEVVIRPRSTAIPGAERDLPTQRDRHLAMITEQSDWLGRSRPVTAGDLW